MSGARTAAQKRRKRVRDTEPSVEREEFCASCYASGHYCRAVEWLRASKPSYAEVGLCAACAKLKDCEKFRKVKQSVIGTK
jgi:hypothetical protein